MAIVRRPRSYTALSLMILWAIPIFFLNIWVLHKGALTKVLHHESLVWMSVQATWCLMTMLWLLGATWKGFASMVTLAATMLAVNVFFLVTTKNYALAFYALFLLISSLLYGLNVFRNLREPFYHSGRRWYEGLPRFLPAIEASLKSGESLIPARVSRIGTEGLYLFPGHAAPSAVAGSASIELRIGDRMLDVPVDLVSRSKGIGGYGFRFVADDADRIKDIREFIDRVRSSGYV